MTQVKSEFPNLPKSGDIAIIDGLSKFESIVMRCLFKKNSSFRLTFSWKDGKKTITRKFYCSITSVTTTEVHRTDSFRGEISIYKKKGAFYCAHRHFTYDPNSHEGSLGKEVEYRGGGH